MNVESATLYMVPHSLDLAYSLKDQHAVWNWTSHQMDQWRFATSRNTMRRQVDPGFTPQTTLPLQSNQNYYTNQAEILAPHLYYNSTWSISKPSVQACLQPKNNNMPVTAADINPSAPAYTTLVQTQTVPVSSPLPSQSSGDNSSTIGAPTATPEIGDIGIALPSSEGLWRCGYSGCKSRAVFSRGCDLRKHYKRHMNLYFCRHAGCPASEEQVRLRCAKAVEDGGDVEIRGMFSSKKDRGRHEASHAPTIRCDFYREGDEYSCRRTFSRKDNMKDHVRRIHILKGRNR